MGRACAWLLLQRGHRVLLIDPGLDGQRDPSSGSEAALGVLMAQVFHRNSGRAWRLRQRSLELWGQWRQQLQGQGWELPWRPGLLLLASTPEALERQRQLVASRRQQGFALELWDQPRLDALAPALPIGALGGLYSPADGQLDPGPALAALLADGLRLGLQTCCDRVERLEQRPGGWSVHTRSGELLKVDALALSAGVASTALLTDIGHQVPMEPVLGQALELELPLPTNSSSARPWPGALCWPGALSWPGAVVWQGLNLVPRASCKLWLGATLEPGDQADPAALANLQQLGGGAPEWLQQATVVRQWQGHRPHPIGRPAPLLEQLEPGLVLASGHYRNGVLLAPATAEWVADQLEQG